MSQIGCLFNYNDTTTSWCFTKQTLVATSANHFEIIALYEAHRKSVWLKFVICHVWNTCHLTLVINSLTVIFEDNVACVAQVKERYIKGDKTKHISLKIFYNHEL